MSFIYDKTSPSKGGMIGTVYQKSSFDTDLNVLYISRFSPEDPTGPWCRKVHDCHGP